MIATGRPMIMSRRMPPPTAEQTPTNTAGTSGKPERERLARAEGAEQADDERVEADDDGVEPLEEAGQQHPDQSRGRGRQEVPVALQRDRRDVRGAGRG